MKNKNTSFLIFLFGFLFQVTSWYPLFLVSTNGYKYDVYDVVLNALTTVLFLFPLISIFGLYLAVINIKRDGISIMTILGLIFNILWLICFLFLLYVMTYLD